jgi:hypothetical protein
VRGDQPVDVVQAVLEDGDTGRHREPDPDPDDDQHPEAVADEGVVVDDQARDQTNRGDHASPIGEPLELQPLIPGGPTQADQGRGRRRQQGNVPNRKHQDRASTQGGIEIPIEVGIYRPPRRVRKL